MITAIGCSQARCRLDGCRGAARLLPAAEVDPLLADLRRVARRQLLEIGQEGARTTRAPMDAAPAVVEVAPQSESGSLFLPVPARRATMEQGPQTPRAYTDVIKYMRCHRRGHPARSPRWLARSTLFSPTLFRGQTVAACPGGTAHLAPVMNNATGTTRTTTASMGSA